VPGRRAAHDRGVGGATGDDDVGARVQRLDDAPAAQVGVGGDEPRRVADGLPGVEVGQVDAGRHQLVEPAEDVVPVDVGDGGRQAELVGELGDRVGAAVGVEAPGVGHHLDALVEAGAHHLLHLGDEGAGEAAVGPLGPAALEDEHRQLGQPVAGEHVDGPALDHLAGGSKAVAVEPGAVGDADQLGHVSSPSAEPSSMTSSVAPLSTWSPAATWISVTTPATGARTWCSIFMASSTTRTCPASTSSPTAQRTSSTAPGMGAWRPPPVRSVPGGTKRGTISNDTVPFGTCTWMLAPVAVTRDRVRRPSSSTSISPGDQACTRARPSPT